MNIDFELYRIFCVVAKNENITKAADELMISQPAVSKAIKKLEGQLGGMLFKRTKKGVVLTEEGKEFYYYLKQAMEQIGNAESRFTELIHLEVGTIRIGVSTTLAKSFLIPYLDTFHQLYPKINIQISTYMTKQLISRLEAGLLDLVILNLPYPVPSEIEIKNIKRVRDCFIVGKKFLESHQELLKKVPLESLKNYPLILQTKGSSARAFLDNYLKEKDVSLEASMDLSSFSLVSEFTKIGFGIGCSTKEYIEKEVVDKELYCLDVEPEIPSRWVGLAYSKKNSPSFCTKKLMEIILKENEN